MNSYENYYLTKLYPLQDGIIKVLNSPKFPFYLTGGTALSRGYYNHRYSDDLDFFINNSNDFLIEIKNVIGILDNKKNNFKIIKEKSILNDYFFQVYAEKDNILLKLDFVNDTAVHFGRNTPNKNLGLLDSIENILTNKITALSRYEPKDIADIWIISRNFRFNWEDILSRSKEKELGIDPVIISDILGTFPEDRLNYIKWTSKTDYTNLIDDLKVMVKDILESKDNSLSN